MPLSKKKVTVPVRGPPAVVLEGMLTVAVKLTEVPAFAWFEGDMTAMEVPIFATVSDRDDAVELGALSASPE